MTLKEAKNFRDHPTVARQKKKSKKGGWGPREGSALKTTGFKFWQRTWIWFLLPTWWLMAACDQGPSSGLFWHYMYVIFFFYLPFYNQAQVALDHTTV